MPILSQNQWRKNLPTETQATETGPTAAQMEILSNLPNHGPAPELLNDTFLNSEALTLAELRGKVVIVEFWTIWMN